MADINQEAQELAEAMRQAAEDIRRYGRLQQDTADALETGSKRRAKELDAAGKAGADALASVASAALGAGTAMFEGKKGAAAFNSSLDDMSKAATAAGVALTFLIPGGPVLKLFVAGVTAATVALLKYTKAANEMGDKLYKGFSKMQQSGANASDGLTGLFKDAKKLGLSMDELDSLVATVAANSKGLAGFSGSVAEGRKQLANIGKAMESSRGQFLRMGIGMEELADATAGYMRLQSTTGRINRSTSEENAAAVKRYVLEQDALTKLTGMTRKESEDAREQVRSQERFGAKLEELRQQGRDKEAKELENSYLMLASKSKAAAQGFADISTGNLQTEEAQKLYRATQGEALGITQQISAGQRNAAQAVQQIAERAGETATKFGPIMGQLGTYNDTYGDLAGTLKLRGMAESDIVKTLEKIEADRKKMGDATTAATDPLLESQGKLREAQIKANEATENFVFKGIVPATEAMTVLANATAKAAGKLDQLTPGGASMTNDTRNQVVGGVVGAGAGYMGGKMLAGAASTAASGAVAKMVTGKMMGKVIGGALGSVVGSVVPVAGTLVGGALGAVIGDKLGDVIANTFFGGESAQVVPEPRAAGGPVGAGKPYLVGERGPELMVPKGSGDILNNDKTRAEMGKIGQSFDVMSKDIKIQEEQIVKDTKTQKTFSLKSNRLMTMKDKLMDEEIKLLEEQNDLLEKMVEHAEKLGGKEAGADVRKMFHMTRALGQGGGLGMSGGAGSSAAGAAMGGGGGLKMPSSPGITGMGGGQGLQVTKQDDLSKMGLKIKTGDVQAEGAGISPKLIEMARQIQGGVPGFGYFSSFNDKFHQEKAPGSQHAKGLAVDFTVAQPPSVEDGRTITSWLKGLGASLAIDEYNNPSSKSTAGHFHAQIPGFADGGIVDKPTLAQIGEKGPEAIIPLKGGAVPVHLDSAPTFAGMNEYKGFNQGPMSTDLNVIKEITASMGAFDKATQTITDPATWKEILNSGIATNYNLGMMEVGTKMIPNIGQDMTQRMSEIVAEQGVDQKAAFEVMTQEFKTAMMSVVKDMFKDTEEKSYNFGALADGIRDLVSKQSEANDISKKILAVSQ